MTDKNSPDRPLDEEETRLFEQLSKATEADQGQSSQHRDTDSPAPTAAALNVDAWLRIYEAVRPNYGWNPSESLIKQVNSDYDAMRKHLERTEHIKEES